MMASRSVRARGGKKDGEEQIPEKLEVELKVAGHVN